MKWQKLDCGLESFRCRRVLSATQLCLRRVLLQRDQSTQSAKALLTAAKRAQTHPRIGRNEKWCGAQIMPRTAHEHAKQDLQQKRRFKHQAPNWCRERTNCRDERWDWWKPSHAKAVCKGLLHFFTDER